jgi:hypothetical protein
MDELCYGLTRAAGRFPTRAETAQRSKKESFVAEPPSDTASSHANKANNVHKCPGMFLYYQVELCDVTRSANALMSVVQKLERHIQKISTKK